MNLTFGERQSMRGKTCCFTGHRNLTPQEEKEIDRRLAQTLIRFIQSGVRYFGAGGAIGFDTLAAQTVLKLRKQYPHIKLILVFPCLSQTRGWEDNDIKIYEEIKARADKVVYTSQEYTRGCMHKRNRHLVDHSGICVCYLRSSKGGTAYTVDYAQKNGVPVINLWGMPDV